MRNIQSVEKIVRLTRLHALSDGDRGLSGIETVSALERREERVENDLLYDLDEIDNKPWRVFRQLAKIMPEYAETYLRYEAFYAFGGSKRIEALMDEFEKTDDYKQSGYPEMIEQQLKTLDGQENTNGE